MQRLLSADTTAAAPASGGASGGLRHQQSVASDSPFGADPEDARLLTEIPNAGPLVQQLLQARSGA